MDEVTTGSLQKRHIFRPEILDDRSLRIPPMNFIVLKSIGREFSDKLGS